MSNWNKRTKGKRFSRSMVVKTRDSQERDLFLSIAMPMLNNIGAMVESRLNRIEIEIFGDYNQIDSLIEQLRNLESYIFEALNPDREGYYYLHNVLLTKLFSPPVNLKLFARGIEAFGYNAKVISNALGSTATIEELRPIHKKIVELRNKIIDNVNSEIERFVVMLSLESNIDDINLILNEAIDSEIIKINETSYHLTTDFTTAKDKMLQKLSSIEGNPLEISEDELSKMSIEDLMFDGGKIVFTKKGREIDETELDHSFYDRGKEKEVRKGDE